MFFTWIANLLGGGIVNSILQAYQSKLAADNSEQATRAKLASDVAALEVQKASFNRDVLISEQGHWFTAIIRPLFAVPFVIYLWKLVIWDKVLGWGVTDGLSSDLTSIEHTVIAAYFGYEGLTTAMRIWKR
jgi:hypothetical protein